MRPLPSQSMHAVIDKSASVMWMSIGGKEVSVPMQVFHSNRTRIARSPYGCGCIAGALAGSGSTQSALRTAMGAASRCSRRSLPSPARRQRRSYAAHQARCGNRRQDAVLSNHVTFSVQFRAERELRKKDVGASAFCTSRMAASRPVVPRIERYARA
jgi:hypothetical protein